MKELRRALCRLHRSHGGFRDHVVGVEDHRRRPLPDHERRLHPLDLDEVEVSLADKPVGEAAEAEIVHDEAEVVEGSPLPDGFVGVGIYRPAVGLQRIEEG